jgi:hypothetical protein
VADQAIKNPSFIAVVKANEDFSENYGRLLGALLYWLSMRESRPPSSPLKVLIPTVGAVVIALITKHDLSAWVKLLWS